MTTLRFIFTIYLNRPPQTKAIEVNPAFLPGRTRLYLTIIQIKQQERSFLRRLCVLKIDIYEPKFNARRAY